MVRSGSEMTGQTKKQKAARERNHLIMRLRGAASVFQVIQYKFDDLQSIKAADSGLREIDFILNRMGAETEADRKQRYIREFL